MWFHKTPILKSNFCDPCWERICPNKWHPGISEISTPPEIAVGTSLHARHGFKTIPVFLPANGETSWSLLPRFGLLAIRRHLATRKHLFLYLQGDRSGQKAKKGQASTLHARMQELINVILISKAKRWFTELLLVLLSSF